MNNDRLVKLVCSHFGKRLEKWYRGKGFDSLRAMSLCHEYASRYTKAMGEADFGPHNERFTSYGNCLSGLIAYAMAREQGLSAEDGIACYDYMAGPVRKLAAGLWNAADLLPRGFELVRDSVRDDLTGPKGVCWTTEIVEDSDERFEYRCHACLYYDICCEHGYPEAIQLFCSHDHFAWDGLGRHVRFVRYGGIGERRADGSLSDGTMSTEPGCLCHDAFVRVHSTTPRPGGLCSVPVVGAIANALRPTSSEALDIDYGKHVEYLPATKAVLTRRLSERFGADEVARIWEEAKHLYTTWCPELPYTGGSKNVQAHSLYDSIMCFAYWEAMPEGRRETVEEFTQTVSLVFNGDQSKARRNPDFLTVNNEPLARVAGCAIGFLFDQMVNRRVDAGEWGNAWAVRVNDPAVEGVPIRVQLIGCPIVDFARAHGFEYLLPAMCNPDFESMRGIGVHLIRPHTVAMGFPDCDNMMVGDRTELAAATPARMDESGFLVNDLPAR